MARLSAEAVFEKMRADGANATCCDGGAGVASWASASHGIFLSIGAAGVHRSLGVSVSFVQSMELDAWRPVHLRMMELGGNQRFRDFLHEQGVPENLPIREKYATRAAAWYRKALRARAEGRAEPAPLAPGIGALRCEEAACAAGSALDVVFVEQPQAARAAETSWMCRTLCAGFKVVLGTPAAPGRPSKAMADDTDDDDSDDDSSSPSADEMPVVGQKIVSLESCSASFSKHSLPAFASVGPGITVAA